jgi:hypothetical protein
MHSPVKCRHQCARFGIHKAIVLSGTHVSRKYIVAGNVIDVSAIMYTEVPRTVRFAPPGYVPLMVLTKTNSDVHVQ